MNPTMAVVAYRVRKLVRFRLRAFVGLTAAVAIVCGFVLALLAGAARTASAPTRYAGAIDAPWDVIVEQQGGSARTTEIGSLPSVARAAGVTFLFAGLVPEGREDPVDAISFAGTHEAFGTRVVEGMSEDAEVALGFTASRSFLEAAGPGTEVGSRFTLLAIPQAAAEASGFDAADQAVAIGEATLVGVLDGATDLQDGFAVTTFPTSVLEAGDIGTSGTQVVVELAPGSTTQDLRRDLDVLAGEVGGGVRFGIDPAEIVPPVVRDAAATRAAGVAVLGAIVAVAAVVVLGQILTRQVRADDDLALTLRALGMSNAQRLGEQLGLAAVPTLAGLLIAGGAAWAVSGWFPLGFVEQIEPDAGPRLEPMVHLLGPLALATAVLAWVAASLLVTRRVRATAQNRSVDRLVGRIRRASVATGVRFAFARVPGEAGSGRVALIGLGGVLAGMVAGVTFGASIGRLVDDPHRYGAYELYLGQGGRELTAGTVERVGEDPAVADFGIAGTVLASVGPDAIDLSAIETVKGDVDPHVFTGRLPVVEDEIALGKVTARDVGVGVGDRITVAAEGGEFELTVTALVVVPSIEGGDGIGTGGIVSVEGFRRLDPDAVLNAGLGNFAAGVDRASVMEGITTDLGIQGFDDRTNAFGGDPPGDIVNLDRIRAIPYVVAGAFGALSLLALAHQLLVSGRRRRHDLAVLRALGADDRWIDSAARWQATAVAGASLAVALPVGLLLGRFAYRTYADRLGVVLGATYGVALLVLAAMAIVALANVVAAITARGARRRSTAELLASE